MKIPLGPKVIGLALLSAFIPTIALYVLLNRQSEPLLSKIDSEIISLVDSSLGRIVENVYSSCQTVSDLAEDKLQDISSIARYLIKEKGDIVLSRDSNSWNAINQETLEVTPLQLPKVLLGRQEIAKNNSFNVPSPIIDDIQTLTDSAATIFQLMPDNSGIIRVATNVKAQDGQTRAIGTFIPAKNKDGSDNEIVKSILEGKTYKGTSFALNDWYLAQYEPIKDAQGKTIAVLSVGIKQQSIQSLNKAIKDISVGRDGYVWVLRTNSTSLQDSLVLKSENKQEKEVLNSASDRFYKMVLETAPKLKPQEIKSLKARWIDPSDVEPSGKTIQFAYFPDWKWIIGVTAYDRDFDSAYFQVRSTYNGLLASTRLTGIIVLIIVGALAFYFGRRITHPITEVTSIAKLVAKGDIGSALAHIKESELRADSLTAAKNSGDETGMLYQAVTQMIDNLNRLIGQVKQSSIQLISTATEISATAKTQENTVHDFSTSSNEIAAAVKEISSTSQELYKTMSNVSDVANETGSMADAGLRELENMQGSMQNLIQASSSIASKLAIITEKTGNINNVVTTISKVADQTNLLSLNASIEAEKAGEYGVGFAVVAREIRRLADQTAVATLDIEQIVNDMQSSVSAGVMEMDKFNEEVRSGADEVGQISDHLEKIIIQVQDLSPRFESVKGGMQSQTQGAQQINDAMINLTDAAERTTNSLKEFEQATRDLHKSVDALRGEVSRFNVSEQPNSDKHEK